MANLFTTTGAYGKDTWLPRLYEQLEDTPGLFYMHLEANDPERIEGRKAFFKVEMGDSLGNEFTSDGGNFPAPVDATYAEATLDFQRMSHTIELTFGEWEMLQTGDGAAAPIVARKMTNALQKFVRETARVTLMPGDAKLARCAASGPALVVNLQSARGGTSTANQIDRDAFNWLAANRARIDIVDATTGAAIANGSNRTIIATSKGAEGGTNTVTLDAAGGNVTTTTSHVITWANSVSAFSSGAYTSGEFVGVGGIPNTARTYLNINSATAGNQWWDGVAVTGDTAGTNQMITLDRVFRLLNAMALSAADGMQPTAEKGYEFFSNTGVAAAAVQYLAPAIRYMDPTPNDTPDFGWRRVAGLGIPWFVDIHYPHNVLDCWFMPDLHRVRPKVTFNNPMDFVTSGSGSIWHLKNASSGGGHATAVRAYLTALMGVKTGKPANHGRLNDNIELG